MGSNTVQVPTGLLTPGSGAWSKFNHDPTVITLQEGLPQLGSLPIGPISITTVALDVQVASDLGVIRIGLFTMFNGLPFAELLGSETTVVSTSTGVKQIPLPQTVRFGGGVLGLVVVQQGSSVTQAQIRGSNAPLVPMIIQGADMANSWSSDFLLDTTATPGALPNPYPAARWTPFGAAGPSFAVKAA